MKRKSIAWALGLLFVATLCIGATMSEWRNGRLVFYDGATMETLLPVAPVVLADDFIGIAVNTTNDWTLAGVNSGTAALTTGAGGILRITTGTADDDDVDFATALTWQAGKSCAAEARVAINDVSGEGFVFGFSDATGEAADTLAVTWAAGDFVSTASDFAGILYDPDYDDMMPGANTPLLGVSVKANADGSPHESTVAPSDAEYHVFRIEIDSTGAVDFWIDGAHLGRNAAAITTSTPLCVYLGVINREGASNTVDVDYVRAWQER